MCKLHDVRGRITYISSGAKQENLYAVYETTEGSYWRELARYNQEEFKKIKELNLYVGQNRLHGEKEEGQGNYYRPSF